jgi:hypothetical protein
MTIVTNIVAGRVAAQMGVRPVITLGLMVAAGGYALLHDIDKTTSYVSMLPDDPCRRRANRHGRPDGGP